jgi:aconitase B
MRVGGATQSSVGSADWSFNNCATALKSSMIEMDYEDKKTIARRIQAMQKWLDAPELLTADDNAEYAATIEINLDDIKEPKIFFLLVFSTVNKPC